MDYKKVIKNFNNGTIDPKKWVVVMDNDSGYWGCIDESLSYEQQEMAREKMNKEYGKPKGYKDIVDVLGAAGVNAEWC